MRSVPVAALVMGAAGVVQGGEREQRGEQAGGWERAVAGVFSREFGRYHGG
jgi:hypothetical protein